MTPLRLTRTFAAARPPKRTLTSRARRSSYRSLRRARTVGVRSLVAWGPFSTLTVGLPRSTVQVCTAGLASVLPALSVARTRSSCSPCPSLLNVAGELHAAHAPPSRLHSKVLPGSEEVKVNVAAGPRPWPFGPSVMVVSGAVVSPGAGLALTVTVTLPSPAATSSLPA